MTTDLARFQKGTAVLLSAALLHSALGPALSQAAAQQNTSLSVANTTLKSGITITPPAVMNMHIPGSPGDFAIMPTLQNLNAATTPAASRDQILSSRRAELSHTILPNDYRSKVSDELPWLAEARRLKTAVANAQQRVVNDSPSEKAIESKLARILDTAAQTVRKDPSALSDEVARTLRDIGNGLSKASTDTDILALLDAAMNGKNGLAKDPQGPASTAVKGEYKEMQSSFRKSLSLVQELTEADQTPSAEDVAAVRDLPAKIADLEARYPDLKASSSLTAKLSSLAASLRSLPAKIAAKTSEAGKTLVFVVNIQKEIRNVALSIARERGYDAKNLSAGRRQEIYNASRAQLIEKADLMGIPYSALKAALTVSRILEALPAPGRGIAGKLFGALNAPRAVAETAQASSKAVHSALKQRANLVERAEAIIDALAAHRWTMRELVFKSVFLASVFASVSAGTIALAMHGILGDSLLYFVAITCGWGLLFAIAALASFADSVSDCIFAWQNYLQNRDFIGAKIASKEQRFDEIVSHIRTLDADMGPQMLRLLADEKAALLKKRQAIDPINEEWRLYSIDRDIRNIDERMKEFSSLPTL
ncbi:MAG: hypothetical protein WCU88_09135 [Elusimicrobiota bacterium]